MKKKTNIKSLAPKDENLLKIKKLFPEVFSDGQLDFSKLKNILAYQTEDTKESYKFEWSGKGDCFRSIQTPSLATLKYMEEESINDEKTENLIIEGDNLEIIKLLQASYKEKIKLIYVDPPYNTGKDFIYTDNFKSSLRHYLEITGQTQNGERISSTKSSSGRKHSNWLQMIYPRLALARNLLKKDGLMFISIDDHEISNLLQICDEIFGEENRLAIITVKSNARGSQASKFFSDEHEYLVCYAKDANEKIEIGYERSSKDFIHKDKDGNYFREIGLRQRGGEWRREQRPNMYYPIYINPKNGEVSSKKNNTYCEISLPIRPSSGEDGRWTWGKETFEKDKGLLFGRKVNREGQEIWDVFRKDYLRDKSGDLKKTKVKTIWDDKEINYQEGRKLLKNVFNGKDVFDFPKPPKLMEMIISSINLNNEIVLDLFAGSGTLGHVILEQNHKKSLDTKFILIQMPEKIDDKKIGNKESIALLKELKKPPLISEILKERIKRVIGGYGESPIKLNAGFKVFKLAASNYRVVDEIEKTEESNNEELISLIRKRIQSSLIFDDSLTDNYKEINVVYENLIKEGLSLNSEIKKIQIEKNSLYEVSDDKGKNKLIYLCFEKLHKETINSMEFTNTGEDTILICFDIHLTDSDKANLSKTFKIKTM